MNTIIYSKFFFFIKKKTLETFVQHLRIYDLPNEPNEHSKIF